MAEGKKLGLAGKLICVAVGLVSLFSGNAKASDPNSWGYLQIKNNLNSTTKTMEVIRDTEFYPLAVNGKDVSDISSLGVHDGNPNTYTDVNDSGIIYHLNSDIRPNDSNIPYDNKFSFRGMLTESKPNWTEFSLFCGGTFGNKPILFQSSRLPYGPVVDVKRAIAKNAGRVDLIDVPAGNYDQWVPYGSGRLDIGTRLLADLDDSNNVNMKDFSILAQDWQNPQGKHVGDISGEYGIPDGYVNNYDLEAFTGDWLQDVNDPNTFSKSISTPKIIPQNYEFYQQQRQEFFAKYGSKKLEGKVDNLYATKEKEAA